MSLTYGFYNSSDHDRLYNALQVSQLFDGLIENGVYETIGGALMVKASEGMTVHVQPGRAWFDHTWTWNDAVLPLVLDPSDSIVSRIDAIVLEIDARRDIRMNSIKILKGTPSADNPQRPELINTDEQHQYPLAYIRVNADATVITQANITNMVGTSECPFVIGVVKSMDVDELVAQWGQEWEEWVADKTYEINSWSTAQQNAFTAWKNEQQSEFMAWFNNLVYVLDGDVAGHLQNEIDELERTAVERYVPYTLYANQWTDDLTYSLENDYPSSTYNIVGMNVPYNIDEEVYDQLLAANVYGFSEDNIIYGHDGDKPTVDIPVILTIVYKEAT